MKSRHRAREVAVQMLYQADLGGAGAEDVLRDFDSAGADVPPAALEYAARLLRGTLNERERIDRHIRSQAENWRLERMPAVDRNILRLAVYELLHEREIPPLVVLDEAIELAKSFGSEQSGAFVNGLLDGLMNSVGNGEEEE